MTEPTTKKARSRKKEIDAFAARCRSEKLQGEAATWLESVEAKRFGAEDAQRSTAYRARIAELQAELDRERARSRAMHRRAQRAEGATSPDVTWEDGYMTGWRRGRRGEGYVDPNPYLEDTGPRAVARRTPTALLGEPDASR